MTLVPRPKPWEHPLNENNKTNENDVIENITTQQRDDNHQIDHMNINNNQDGNNNINFNNESSQPPPIPGNPPNYMMNTPYYRGGNYGINSQSSMGYGLGSTYGMNNGYGYGMNSSYGMSGGLGSTFGNVNYPGYGYNNGYLGNNNGMNGEFNGGLADSTRATFQLLENVVGTINGFAQMLESSYMATYNSFFTLISFAEEATKLKDILGGMFGVFNVMKIFKKLLNRNRINRQRALEDGGSSLVGEFSHFKSTGQTPPKKKKMSLKPLIVFFLAVFGFPYVLNKLIKRVHEMNNSRRGVMAKDSDGVIDPSNLEFARALYDFIPENPKIEVTLKKGDLMAIISKSDPFGKLSEWWQVRTKGGSMGYVPYNYIEIIKRHKKIEHIDERNKENSEDLSGSTPVQSSESM